MSDTADPLIRLEGVKKYFDSSNGLFDGFDVDFSGDGFPISYAPDEVKAVDDVSLEIQKGETLGLVGESGCGKSTLGRTILRLLHPTDGNIYFKGRDIADLSREELRRTRQEQQIIFQDPSSSLNPRMKVGPIIQEPMEAHGIRDQAGREERARELLETVGLDPSHYNRYPHQFSGGQQQRINLARALSVNPEFIVCDEPTSALDASIQAQVLNTMRKLQEEFDLTYLFISHDLSVIRHICDRVAVMYLGQIVELGEKTEIFERPKHPYTQSLLSSIPIPDPRLSGERDVLEGDVPDPANPPSGCRFRTRCPELIAPGGYDLRDDHWNTIRTFMRAVNRREFDIDRRGTVEEEYFETGTPGGEAGRHVDEAIDMVVEDQWENAETVLAESFAQQSVCAQEVPEVEMKTDGAEQPHTVACQLYSE